ncbi:HotDog domain-containing protein [Trichoderma ceciliae]
MSDNDNNIPHKDSNEGKLQAWLDHFATRDDDNKGWMHNLIPGIRIVSASSSLPHPSITFSFTVQKEHTNGFGNLHGGAAASLLDFCTSMVLALISKPGFWQTMGVSRTLNTTYMRPVPAGMEVLMECEILQVGKRLCALRGTMRRKNDGELLCVCEHNKANVDPDPKL